MRKKYVKVIVEMDELGNKKPVQIIYDDRKFNVDRVIDMRHCASMKVGGIGERYRVRIGNKETYVFFEDGKWFVESI